MTMNPQNNNQPRLSFKVKVIGTFFLIFQVLFAANNYGPQHIPLLSLVFDEPWVTPQQVFLIGDEFAETGAVYFEDITEAAGLGDFRRAVVNPRNPNYLEVMGGGVAVADVTGNGFDDIFLISMPSFVANDPHKYPSTLYRNNGDGTFTDITKEWGLDRIEGYPQGALFFDFNNNGRQDLYVAAYQGSQLFRNDGGHFTDITAGAGLSLDGLCGNDPCFASAASAADYNRDGYLDLLVVNNVDWDINDPSQYGEQRLFPAFFKAQPSILFRNNGDGTFTNVTEETGIQNRDGKGLSAVWFDFTQNGWPDLYFANDLSRNRLYINNGDGTFREMGAGAQVNEVKSSMGVAAADVTGNGHQDLFTTNLEGTGISFFRNSSFSRFEFATHYSGLNPTMRSSGWGVELIDLNRNGRLDLVMAAGPVWDPEPKDAENLFFLNRGNGQFEDITFRAGDFENRSTSRGLSVLDIYGDGQPDLVILNIDGSGVQLLHNRTSNENSWVTLRLTGTESNRDAIGARVVLTRTDGKELTQEVKAGSSYQSTSSKALFFGLADAGVAELKIQWPSGREEVLYDLPTNRIVDLVEGEALTESYNRPASQGN